MDILRRVCITAAILACGAASAAQGADETLMKVRLDPTTRYFHITYAVPAGAPDEVTVLCSWSAAGRNDWRPARVMPYISEMTLRFTPKEEWDQWQRGRVVERRAAGLERTVVFNPYPEAQSAGKVAADFRVQVRGADGTEPAGQEVTLQADNSDVVYLEDWSQVLQKDAFADDPPAEARKWRFITNLGEADGATLGNALYGNSPADVPLPQLTYPLNLRGPFALFLRSTPGKGVVNLRLTGDERSDYLYSPRPGEEVFWRWCPLDRQHLVVKQSHRYTGYQNAHIDYVKLVPLTAPLVAALDAPYVGARDKIVAGYWEPYSWAFSENVQDNWQHREPLTAYVAALVSIVDMQIDRGGMKAIYESRIVDQLVYSTEGDPIGSVAHPTTDNVGRMQQYTNTLGAELQYARELGLTLFANFGASNCYPGSVIQNDFSKAHPEWLRGHALRYEVPEVRAYMLSLFREALEIGAPGLTVDFGRYPQTIDKPETANVFLREMRALADEVGGQRGTHVPIIVHFPAQGDTLWENFDYPTWAQEGSADYICPSQHNRVYLFDIQPYLDGVRGTKAKLLPDVYGGSDSVEMPGLFLWRVKQLYDAGVDGIYIYQSDARVLGPPQDRRTMRLLGSSEAVQRWWADEERERPRRSKGIYLNNRKHNSERIRVWIEGIPLGAVEFVLDGQPLWRCDGPPYILGTELPSTDKLVPPGGHTLLIRARDGDGWLEQPFSISGPG